MGRLITEDQAVPASRPDPDARRPVAPGHRRAVIASRVRWEPVERGVGDPLKPETRLVEVSAPWYQWFPIDLVAEFLWPATIVDEHVFDFTLSPISASELEAEYREAARERGLLFPTDDSQKSDSTDRPGR